MQIFLPLEEKLIFDLRMGLENELFVRFFEREKYSNRFHLLISIIESHFVIVFHVFFFWKRDNSIDK